MKSSYLDFDFDAILEERFRSMSVDRLVSYARVCQSAHVLDSMSKSFFKKIEGHDEDLERQESFIGRNKYYYILYAVAQNSATRMSTLFRLYKSENNILRECVASNKTIETIKFYELMLKDKDPWVQVELAKNSNTPQKVVKELMQSDNYRVKAELLKRSDLTEEQRDFLTMFNFASDYE